MILAAELGALAHVRPLLLRDERHVVRLAGDEVLLVEEVHHPEGVQRVAGVELELDLGVDRQVERGELVLVDGALRAVRVVDSLDALLVRAALDGLAGLGLAAEVVEVPRPLLAEDLDLDLGLVEAGLDGGLVLGGEREEAEDEDQRHDRVEDLDRHVVAHLHGQAGLALAAAVHDRGPDGEAPGEDAHREEDDPGGDPQADDRVHVVGRARFRRQEALELLLRAPREEYRDAQGDGDRQPTLTASEAHVQTLRRTGCDGSHTTRQGAARRTTPCSGPVFPGPDPLTVPCVSGTSHRTRTSRPRSGCRW